MNNNELIKVFFAETRRNAKLFLKPEPKQSWGPPHIYETQTKLNRTYNTNLNIIQQLVL